MKTADEIRTMLYQRLNHQLRRPGMYFSSHADLEVQIRQILGDLMFIDEKVKGEKTVREELIEEGFYCPTNVAHGVYCMFKNIMPDVNDFQHEVCSVYARKAHQLNYLEIANILPDKQFQSIIERIIEGEFSKGINRKNILEKLLPPSFDAGYIYCYAPEDLMGQWIYFDIATKFVSNKRYDYLRSIRWPAKTFEDGFELTYEGYEVTRRGIAKPKFDIELEKEMFMKRINWDVTKPGPFIKEDPRESRWKHLW